MNPMTVGLRIPGACAKEDPDDFARWCKTEGFDGMDLGRPDEVRLSALKNAGLTLGTIDLPGTGKLLSPDAAVRNEGITEANNALAAIAAAGGDKAFCVFFPQNASQSRRDSMENWTKSFPEVAREADRAGVSIAVEGWPGPNNSALGVAPETLRLMFEAVPTPAFGINYDPSHLARIGVDYLRVLEEFAHRVVHVHGKDTAFDAEALYQFGTIGPTFARSPAFGEGHWRYTIPGEGACDWAAICARLARAGFEGMISVELEDFRYNGSVEGEKLGLSRARAHLARFV